MLGAHLHRLVVIGQEAGDEGPLRHIGKAAETGEGRAGGDGGRSAAREAVDGDRGKQKGPNEGRPGLGARREGRYGGNEGPQVPECVEGVDCDVVEGDDTSSSSTSYYA